MRPGTVGYEIYTKSSTIIHTFKLVEAAASVPSSFTSITALWMETHSFSRISKSRISFSIKLVFPKLIIPKMVKMSSNRYNSITWVFRWSVVKMSSNRYISITFEFPNDLRELRDFMWNLRVICRNSESLRELRVSIWNLSVFLSFNNGFDLRVSSAIGSTIGPSLKRDGNWTYLHWLNFVCFFLLFFCRSMDKEFWPMGAMCRLCVHFEFFDWIL